MALRVHPSSTARIVAVTRGMARRPAVPSGDQEAEGRLLRSLRTPTLFRMPGMAAYIAARTQFYDELLLRTCASGTRQVVIVGAGYDARALRFRQPGVAFFELDHPVTQADKLRRLKALGIDVHDVHFVPVDLTRDSVADALAAAGQDRLSATHFMCEGLTPYLPENVLEHLLRSLAGRAGPSSTIAVDFIAPGRRAGGIDRVNVALWRVGTASLGERMVTLPTVPEVESLLGEAGWANADIRRPSPSSPFLFAAASAA